MNRYHSTRIDRRRFVTLLGTAIGYLAVWRIPQTNEAVADSSAIVKVASLQERLPQELRTYPAPRQMPAPFQLLDVYTHRQDGFGATSDALAYWFVNATHPLGHNHPLSVHIARQPQYDSFTGPNPPQPLIITHMSGTAMQVGYHDGIWMASPSGSGEIEWNTTTAHSITFQLADYRVGIRGSRVTGIELGHLLHIAESIA